MKAGGDGGGAALIENRFYGLYISAERALCQKLVRPEQCCVVCVRTGINISTKSFFAQ